MGASYLCIASKACIEFPKAVGVATATYVQVIEGKHGGIIKELGKKKIRKRKVIYRCRISNSYNSNAILSRKRT